MYVKRVFYDEEGYCAPDTWEEVEKIIDMLDGDKVTEITMDNGDEDNYLCIGGGNDGLCNVFISRNDNEEIYDLEKPNFDEALEHRLVTGGQWGDFEDRVCVEISYAKPAIKFYCQWGHPEDGYFVYQSPYIKRFEDTPLKQRIEYGIKCAQKYLSYKYPANDWKPLFSMLVGFSSAEFWDEWAYEFSEVIPEYLFEFKDYQSSDFEYITEEKYNAMKAVYKGTGDDVNEILMMVYSLATSHIYSSVVGKGNESLEWLDRIIRFLADNGVSLEE